MKPFQAQIIGDVSEEECVYGTCKPVSRSPTLAFQETVRVRKYGLASDLLKHLEKLGMLPYACLPFAPQISRTKFIHQESRMCLFVWEKVKSTGETFSSFIQPDVSSHASNIPLVLLDKGSGFIQKKELVELAKKCRIYLHTVKPIDDWCRDIVFIVINEQTFIASEKFIDDNKSWLAPKLIVTLGERGASYLGEKTGDYYAAIYPAKKSPDKEINSQADAGIAFFAGFVAGYARSQKPETAISLANNYACKILTSSSF